MKKSLGAQTLVYPTPVLVVGSYSPDKKPDAMTAAWGGICCSTPPCIAISVRPARQTHINITANKAFTVSVADEKHVREADFFGIVSGKNTDKFKMAGLTPVASELVNAPYVAEFPLVLECRLLQTLELGSHTQFIGQILDVKADENLLTAEGGADVEKIRPLIYCPDAGMGYYGMGKKIARAFSIGREVTSK